MNKTSLKSFAIEGRNSLRDNISKQLENLGITEKEVLSVNFLGNQVEINGHLYKRNSYEALIKKYKEVGYGELVEECAYTWFNRLTALAYMEANGYMDEKMIFSTTSKVDPDILDEYMDAEFFQNFSDELKNRVHKLKDNHKSEEMYSILIDGKCEELSNIMPFMFSKGGDYAELLFPSGLLMEGSTLTKLRKEMEEAKDENGVVPVEIIGWLYQFYNSEKKDEVFEGLKKNKKITKENIPAATQLFTPKWIVQYMVENSLGKLALESLGVSEELKSNWKYYIESERDESAPKLSVDEIKILDPAMGSGHMLTYSFDLLFDIYEDLGWSRKDAVLSILKNNIFGLEIDDRAGQLASFALMMKGRERFQRLFKVLERLEDEERFELNTFTIGESNTISERTRELIGGNSLNNLYKLIYAFEDAKEYGSILKLDSLDINSLKEELERLKEIQKSSGQGDLFSANATNWDFEYDVKKLEKLIEQQRIMSSKFDVVVSNPPYMGSGGMNDNLKKYLKDNYSDSEKDMMTVFMDYTLEITKTTGYIGMINLPSWMFLNSFEKLRKKIIEKTTIISMVDNGRGVFGSDFGSVSFVLKNKSMDNFKGIYRRLIKKKGAVENNEIKKEWFLNKEFNRFQAKQKDFEKIPGSPIAYWVSDKVREIFEKYDSIGRNAEVITGMTIGKNDFYLRQWQEIEYKKMNIREEKIEEINLQQKPWIPYSKGGEGRKWFGNNEWIVNWSCSEKFNRAKTTLKHLYLKETLTWNFLTSSKFSMRYLEKGFLWDVAGSPCFVSKDKIEYTLGLLLTKFSQELLNIMNPTLNYQAVDIANIPIIFPQSLGVKDSINNKVQQNINIAKQEWDSRETSWDFERLSLVHGVSLEEAYLKYCKYWRGSFFKMHSNEEELNKIFIEIYGLEDEMDESVPLEDITLLKKEAIIVDNDLQFNKEELVKQFLSYALGCIMGRYSIDKPGLIMANSDDIMTIENGNIIVRGKDGDLRHEIINPRFIPDPYGVIPVVKDDNFENDIVKKVVNFVSAVYGEEGLEKNLDFIGEALGKKSSETSRDVIRKYFIKDFYKDHLQRYKKRPIYWMMSSGKKEAFSSLIYLHRYEENTVGRVRADYLIPYQERLDNLRSFYERVSIDEITTPKDRKDAEKRLKELDGELKELREYANEVKHIADQKIYLDLDDGVKVNYEKFGKILKKI